MWMMIITMNLMMATRLTEFLNAKMSLYYAVVFVGAYYCY